jgi:uncharacterized repeat protein (TIGR01451 family)
VTVSAVVPVLEALCGQTLQNAATQRASFRGEEASTDSNTVATLVECPATIDLEKVGSYTPPTLDAPFGLAAWSLTVTNTGIGALTSVAVADDSVNDLDCDPVVDGNQALIATLAAGADNAVTCTATTLLTQADSGQSVRNNASVSATSPYQTGPVTDTDQAEVMVPTLTPGLSLSKTVDTEVVNAPETVTYTFVIENTGNVALTGVELVDPLVDAALIDCDPADGVQGVPTSLAVGADPVTCTVPYEIDRNAINAGEAIVNTAQVTSNQVDSNAATATVAIEQPQSLLMQFLIAVLIAILNAIFSSIPLT